MYKGKIKFRVILLAGGRGSRLGHYTNKVPKPLIKINNKEFLHYVIEFFKSSNVDKFIITTYYKSYLFRNYINKKKIKNIKQIREKNRLGTGGSFLNVLKYIDHEKNYYNILCNADTLFLFSFKKILKKISLKQNYILGLKKNNCKRYGRLKLKSNQIIRIERNNKKKGYISSGIFFFRKLNLNFFKNMNNKQLKFEEDILNKLLKKRVKINCLKLDAPFIDIGVPSDLKKSEKFIKKSFNEYIKKL
tara:strand:+ start:603 stop:1343 length:741 start_codon:yes stop_codon:yes gene_type:complete